MPSDTGLQNFEVWPPPGRHEVVAPCFRALHCTARRRPGRLLWKHRNPLYEVLPTHESDALYEVLRRHPLYEVPLRRGACVKPLQSSSGSVSHFFKVLACKWQFQF